MYQILEHLDDDEMLKTIVLGSADNNYVSLDISYAEGSYSCLALVFDDTHTCIECFHPTLAYPTPYIPFALSYLIRSEMEIRGIPVDDGVATSVFNEQFETQEDGVPYLCGAHVSYPAVCESLGYKDGTLH
jgi:hypothetical protein